MVEGYFSKTKLNEKSLAVVQATAVAAPNFFFVFCFFFFFDEAMLKWTKSRLRPL